MTSLIKRTTATCAPLLLLLPFLALPFLTMTPDSAGGGRSLNGAGFVLLMSLQNGANS